MDIAVAFIIGTLAGAVLGAVIGIILMCICIVGKDKEDSGN